GWTGRPVTSRRGSGEFSDTSVRDLRRGFAPPTPSCRLRRTVPFRDHGPSLRSPSVVARRRTGRLLVWAVLLIIVVGAAAVVRLFELPSSAAVGKADVVIVLAGAGDTRRGWAVAMDRGGMA